MPPRLVFDYGMSMPQSLMLPADFPLPPSSPDWNECRSARGIGVQPRIEPMDRSAKSLAIICIKRTDGRTARRRSAPESVGRAGAATGIPVSHRPRSNPPAAAAVAICGKDHNMNILHMRNEFLSRDNTLLIVCPDLRQHY